MTQNERIIIEIEKSKKQEIKKWVLYYAKRVKYCFGGVKNNFLKFADPSLDFLAVLLIGSNLCNFFSFFFFLRCLKCDWKSSAPQLSLSTEQRSTLFSKIYKQGISKPNQMILK